MEVSKNENEFVITTAKGNIFYAKAVISATGAFAYPNIPVIEGSERFKGWGQPQVGLALDEPEENDTVVIMNDIKVAIDPNIESFTENLTLDFNQEANGLVLLGTESSCC